MSETNIEKYKYGQFSLTPDERKKAQREGNLEEREEKMRQANEQLNIRREQAKKEGGIIEFSEEEERNAEKEGRKALRELGKRFRKYRPEKPEK